MHVILAARAKGVIIVSFLGLLVLSYWYLYKNIHPLINHHRKDTNADDHDDKTDEDDSVQEETGPAEPHSRSTDLYLHKTSSHEFN